MNQKPKARPPVAAQATKTPQGTIRKGQRKPYRKATNLEIERRVDEMAKYLMRHPLASAFDLHKEFCPKFGVNWNTLDSIYTVRARKLLASLTDMSRDKGRQVGLAAVMEVLENGSAKERLAAERSLAAIMGYNAPTRVESTGKDGAPIAYEERPLRFMTSEELVALARQQLTNQGGGQ